MEFSQKKLDACICRVLKPTNEKTAATEAFASTDPLNLLEHQHEQNGGVAGLRGPDRTKRDITASTAQDGGMKNISTLEVKQSLPPTTAAFFFLFSKPLSLTLQGKQ